MQKFFIILGVFFILLGVGWPLIKEIPLGRLPGDFIFKKDQSTIYIPVTSSILVSVLLSLIGYLVNIFKD